jgi:ABC-type Co2+ transport system permease subunit
MAGIAAWLAAIAWPILSRMLLSLGVGTLTYIGLSVAVNTALSQAKSAFTGLPADVLSIIAIAGAFQAMSIIAGGIISGLVFVTVKKFSLKNTG